MILLYYNYIINKGKERYKIMGNYEAVIFKNNQVRMVGEVISDFSYSHVTFGEGFYVVNVAVERLSTYVDIIPVMVSERLVDIKNDFKGLWVEITGQFRSYSNHEDGKNKLVLSVFAREFKEAAEELKVANSIFIDGFVCKPPIYRKTPLGREISDLLIAVNRPYGKSDYIPCVCWGRDARFAENLIVGDRIAVNGRIQCREYIKKLENDIAETRIAYEVSAATIAYSVGEE
ncbi:MAG: single-strand binding protein/Primosomal replication protein n [Sedimentibacter sp.]|jgi:single-stranded DNA-binding protein|nr:single-strand binding protein/Primosomal replication protein n [Sedimentibacter sp.]